MKSFTGCNLVANRWMSGFAPIAIVTAVAVLTTGCAALTGTAEEDDPDEQVSEMELDPILIRAGEDGEDKHLSAGEVFEKGYYAFQARRYEKAVEHYRIIIDYLDDSRFYLPALYNGGLALEELDRWQEAAELFALLIEEFPDTEEARNARFRLANARHELGKYETVAEQLTEMLLRDDLEGFDRIEAHIRRGRALLELEEWVDAEHSFRAAVEINDDKPPTERLDDEHRFMVLAQFGRGKANHGRMNEISLVLPPERMKQDLEDKADYHLTAQAAYIQALRQHHPYWSIAAGYMVGRLYHDLYVSIFSAEIPDDLTERELHYYFEELRNKLEVLIQRALSIYERNLSLSRRIAPGSDINDEWVEATALHKERLQALLEDPLVHQRAEKLMLEQGDLEELWDTPYYARRHVSEAIESALEETGGTDDEPDMDDDEDDDEATDGVARR